MTKHGSAQDEATIRRLVEDRVKAIHAKDVAAVTASHAPDVLTFDLLSPLRYSGVDTVRERTEAWFSSYQGQIGYEIRDLEITAGDEVAFCSFLYRVSGIRTDGGSVEMWVRATTCFRKADGAWTITHEHQSVPFDPESGTASLDLKP